MQTSLAQRFFSDSFSGDFLEDRKNFLSTQKTNKGRIFLVPLSMKCSVTSPPPFLSSFFPCFFEVTTNCVTAPHCLWSPSGASDRNSLLPTSQLYRQRAHFEVPWELQASLKVPQSNHFVVQGSGESHSLDVSWDEMGVVWPGHDGEGHKQCQQRHPTGLSAEGVCIFFAQTSLSSRTCPQVLP